MEKQWQILQPDPNMVKTLTDRLHCHPLVARLLVNRGITSASLASRFMTPSLSNLTAPSRMADMDTAVRRISRAICRNEKILVFGDYDADGITATALVVTFLRHCNARVSYAIPHRLTEGYGLSVDFVKKRACSGDIKLIITADCGSSSHEAVSHARRQGIDTIITDHHPAEQFPRDAVAVLNPTRPDCPSGLAHLAGVGVSYYLIIALRAHLRETGFWQTRAEPNLKRLCDLVAIGTVADVSPLIGENRTFTSVGLEQINHGQRPGIMALKKMSTTADQPIDSETIAFRLAPRINAAGRLTHARMACELLLTEDSRKAVRLAASLCRLNDRRQSMESELTASILKGVDQPQPPSRRSVLVVDGEGWHEGIIGIVAARLAKHFNCPAVVISTRNGIGKGSARSIEPIDITAAISECAGLLDRFGGHPLAAGLTLPSANISDFRNRLERIVGEMSSGGTRRPPFFIDAHLPLTDLSPRLMAHISRLGPFGQGNPAPLFMDTHVRIVRYKRVAEHHRQMVLQSSRDRTTSFPAIAFNVGGKQKTVPRHFEKIAYRPQWNYWNGRKTLQLLIEATQWQS